MITAETKENGDDNITVVVPSADAAAGAGAASSSSGPRRPLLLSSFSLLQDRKAAANQEGRRWMELTLDANNDDDDDAQTVMLQVEFLTAPLEVGSRSSSSGDDEDASATTITPLKRPWGAWYPTNDCPVRISYRIRLANDDDDDGDEDSDNTTTTQLEQTKVQDLPLVAMQQVLPYLVEGEEVYIWETLMSTGSSSSTSSTKPDEQEKDHQEEAVIQMMIHLKLIELQDDRTKADTNMDLHAAAETSPPPNKSMMIHRTLALQCQLIPTVNTDGVITRQKRPWSFGTSNETCTEREITYAQNIHQGWKSVPENYRQEVIRLSRHFTVNAHKLTSPEQYAWTERKIHLLKQLYHLEVAAVALKEKKEEEEEKKKDEL